MKIKYEADITTKDLKICEMKEFIMRFKYIPNKDEFIKETWSWIINCPYSKVNFFQKMFIISPYLETSEQFKNNVIDHRTEFEELNTKIWDHITWQETDEGTNANLPEIEENLKDILFTVRDV